MEKHGCMQAMKKASFYQFVQQQYMGVTAGGEEDLKPIMVGGKIHEARHGGAMKKARVSEVEEEDVKPIIVGGKIREARHCCAMKKASFYQFIWPKAQEQYMAMIPRFEVEIRGNLNLQHLFPWEIKKRLTIGDVGGNGCDGLQLSAEQVQNHILRHWNEKGEYKDWFNVETILEPVVIHDLDTNTDHILFLCKLDAFINIYTIQNSWMKEFVMRRRLFQGALIGMYWNTRRFRLCFSVLESPYDCSFA